MEKTTKNKKQKKKKHIQMDGGMNILDVVAIENFREYLRIPSVHPNIDYDPCIKFLEKQAQNLGLPIYIYYCVPKKPTVVLTWVGEEPELLSILLNSHMDVVPVFADKWTHDPFSAEINEKGNIYARGAQDMKCVGVQYLEAIRRLKEQGITLKRTVHVCFTSDEEIGGVQGMKEFVNSKYFKNLNVGFALDEGGTSPNESYSFYYAERSVWQMLIHCSGQSGHSSLFIKNTAGEKVRRILDKFYTFRTQEENKMKDNPNLTMADVTTVNVTQLQGGVQPNVLPPEMTIMVDCRNAITSNLEQWEETINQWCKEAGENVWVEYIMKEPQIPPTKIDSSNRYWVAFKDAAVKMNLIIKPRVFAGITDSRYLRALGIPVIGFSPMNNTTALAHDHNEYLHINVFLRGVEIYSKLIQAVANVDGVPAS